jgi:lysozyme
MKINRAGLELIKNFEGFVPNAYLCPAGVWTIGYGTTTAADVVEGGVHKGMMVTKDEASDMLSMSLWKYEAAVTRVLRRAPNENQFSAMVSLCYNIGESAFAKSTVLRKFNDGFLAESADAFRMWNKADGKVLPGLIRRREAEIALFLAPTAKGEPPVLADYEVPEPSTPKGPSLMNNNLFGTIAAVIAVVMGGLTQILGCATDAAGNSVCTASWLPPQYAGYAVLLFSGLAIAAKMFRPGGVLHGLFGATAVIVPESKNQKGTVTQSDVNAPK